MTIECSKCYQQQCIWNTKLITKKNTPIKLNDLSSKRWQRFVSSKIFKPSSHGTLIFGCLFYDKKNFFIKIQVMLLNHNIVNFRFEDTNLLMKTELTGQKISFVGICFFFVVSCRVLISVFLLRTDMKSFPNWKKNSLYLALHRFIHFKIWIEHHLIDICFQTSTFLLHYLTIDIPFPDWCFLFLLTHTEKEIFKHETKRCFIKGKQYSISTE